MILSYRSETYPSVSPPVKTRTRRCWKPGDALEEAIAGRIDDAEGIPVPSQKRRGEYLVAVPPNTAAKAAVAIALERSGISKAALAKKLSIHERGVDRILNPRFPANTAMIDHALLALGSEIVMEVRDCPSNGPA